MTHRPLTWDEYIGQGQLKNRLQIHIGSACERGVALPHVLLVATPGAGKTSLASLIAQEMFVEFESQIMPTEPRVLERLLKTHEGVLLLDELHRLPARRQEQLLSVIEDGYFQDSRGNRFENPALTIVGATTEGDKIIQPLYDRFQIKPTYDPYTLEEMTQIVMLKCERIKLDLPQEDAEKLAAATLGVPRNAETFVTMARDLRLALGKTPSSDEILAATRISGEGLREEHLRYCKNLEAAGGIAGAELMTMMLGIPAGAMVNLEIDLIRQGIIERQARGRELTPAGYRFVRNNT